MPALSWASFRPRRSLLICLNVLVCASLASVSLASERIYISNQGTGIAVLDGITLETVGKVELKDQGPRGLALYGKTLLVANQRSGDLAVIDTATLNVVRRIPIGKNPEFLRVLGDKAFVTYEPSSTGGPPMASTKSTKEIKGMDDDDQTPGQVAVVDLKTWKVVLSIKGASETEGIEFTPDGRRIAITNEGDDSVTVYDIATGKLVQRIDLSAHGHRPRGIKAAPSGGYLVTMEDSNNYLVLDERFGFVRSVATGAGPYGVAYDRTGQRLFVAASRADRLEIFDASSHVKLAETAIGKRCWHFSFTPDENQLLVACGRSNDIQVVDARNYRLVQSLSGFVLPWGIVTEPRSNGSLDVPATR